VSVHGTQAVPDVTIIGRRARLLDLDLRALVEFGDLLYFLLWRDIKIRYKQTVIGVGWVVLQPLIATLIFTAVFGVVARVPTDGVPYALFAFSGLVPWTFFANSITRSIGSVVAHAHLIPKVYFPRMLLPIGAVAAGLIDVSIASAVLIGLALWSGVVPGASLLLAPVFLLLAMLTALAGGLWLAPLNARYRDIGHALPFLVQIAMFASPVAYPATLIPERWQWLYGLNPMAGVIEGVRWAVVGTSPPDVRLLAISVSVVLVMLVTGAIWFRRTERVLADVI
jgi:lipopolysaccharide transport system permease protein